MTEAEPMLNHEQMYTSPYEEHHPHAESHDHFTNTAEHEHPGHVCTAECSHTQQEADQFSDSLFNEVKAKHTPHGEHPHECDATCKHTQTEADNFADSLFAETDEPVRSEHAHHHGEKGHVCTAECKHTQAEANSLANSLFEEAKEHTPHGEHPHECDATCKHTQTEADNFADELFAERPEEPKSVSAKVEPSAAFKSLEVDETPAAQREELALAHHQELLRAEHRPDEEIISQQNESRIETASETKEIPKLTNEDESQKIVAEQVKTDYETSSFAAGITSEEDHIGRTVELGKETVVNGDQVRAEEDAIPSSELAEDGPPAFAIDATGVEVDGEFTDFDSTVSNAGLPEAPFAETVGSSDIDLSSESVRVFDVNTDVVINRVASQGGEATLPAIDSEIGVAGKHSRLVEERVSKPTTIEEVLTISPELEPVKELVPLVMEAITNNPDKAAMIQEVQPILGELMQWIGKPENRSELTASTKEQMIENLELLSSKLGIHMNDLLKTLEIESEEAEPSMLTHEILHGLKKWLSVEYSLEFTKIQPQATATSSVSAQPRTIGQLILALFQNVKLSHEGLAGA